MAFVVLLTLTACSPSDEAQAEPQTSITTTAPSITSPTTTSPPTTQPMFETPVEANQFIFGFDPVTGDAEVLRVALASSGLSPGMGIMEMLETGSVEVKAAILDALGVPTIRTVRMVVDANLYGTPSGGEWDEETARALSNLGDAGSEVYGVHAPMVWDIYAQLVALELSQPHQAVEFLGTFEGSLGPNTFVGELVVASDTGEASGYPVRIERRAGSWQIEEGWYMGPFTPALAADERGQAFVVTEAPLELSIVCDAGFGLSVDERPLETRTADAHCAADATLPLEVGTNHFTLEEVGRAVGVIASVELTVRYEPEAERLFGFLTSVDELSVRFDAAEWLTGREADEAAAEAGDISSPDEGVPNDYFILNTDTSSATYSLELGALFQPTPILTDGLALPASSLADRTDLGDLSVWVYVVDGQVVHIEEQYRP